MEGTHHVFHVAALSENQWIIAEVWRLCKSITNSTFSLHKPQKKSACWLTKIIIYEETRYLVSPHQEATGTTNIELSRATGIPRATHTHKGLRDRNLWPTQEASSSNTSWISKS